MRLITDPVIQLFNPAVTLGMALIGAVGWVRAGIVFVAQIMGSIAASAVVLGLFPGPLNVTTSLSSGTSVAQGLCEYLLKSPIPDPY